MTSVKPTLLALARVLIGAVFLWSAISKGADLRTFAEDTANYQMLSPRFSPLWAVALPGIELLAGGLLLLGIWAEACAALVAALLGAFIVALSQALLRGIDLRCGCFGGADLATWGTVTRDVILLLPAFAVLRWGPGRWSVPGLGSGQVTADASSKGA
jgi:uncharacterized membrane protein YphA (DoxX/SURF4 family)